MFNLEKINKSNSSSKQEKKPSEKKPSEKKQAEEKPLLKQMAESIMKNLEGASDEHVEQVIMNHEMNGHKGLAKELRVELARRRESEDRKKRPGDTI